MKLFLTLSVLANLFFAYFIAKRYYYSKIPPVLWKYDIAMLGDSHIYRCNWNEVLGIRVANFGVGSSKVSEMLARVDGVINCKPKVCFVGGGINDILKKVPMDSTIFYYTQIRDQLHQHGIKPVFMQVMKINHSDSINRIVDSLNIRIVKLGEFITAPINTDDLQADGIHLNGSGYEKWAAVIKKHLSGRDLITATGK